MSIPQDPLPRWALHTEVTSPALTAEAAAQPFPGTHAASTMVGICFLTGLERGCTALLLEAAQ